MQANSLFQCITCNREVQQAIYSSFQYPDMPLMFSPFILLGILVLVLAVLACRRRGSDPAVLYRTPLLSAAMILGIGMGGFADGIVLHQILQWHEMLSNRIPPLTLTAKSVNMFWDGIFHAVTWMVTLTGIICIWRALGYPGNSRSGFLLAGGLLQGWAVFNLIEGILNHHLLRLHHVREITGSTDLWNFGFLILSVLLLFIGIFISRRARRASFVP